MGGGTSPIDSLDGAPARLPLARIHRTLTLYKSFTCLMNIITIRTGVDIALCVAECLLSRYNGVRFHVVEGRFTFCFYYPCAVGRCKQSGRCLSCVKFVSLFAAVVTASKKERKLCFRHLNSALLRKLKTNLFRQSYPNSVLPHCVMLVLMFIISFTFRIVMSSKLDICFALNLFIYYVIVHEVQIQ